MDLVRTVFSLLGVAVMVLAQPPAPPEVPKQLLSSIPLENNVPIVDTIKDNTNTGSIQPEVKACVGLICTEEFIPEECRTVPIVNLDGVSCQGCPMWRESCIPPEIEVACPLQACENTFIPQDCMELSTFEFQGKQCKGCPRWREGCKMKTVVPNNPVSGLPRYSCPRLTCDTVPDECQVIKTFVFRRRKCQSCPEWREGCRERERLASLKTPPNSIAEPEAACPTLSCSSITIPDNCREEQPYELNGRTCYRCPKWRKGCEPPSLLNLSNAPAIACPLMKCDIPTVPQECLQEETFLQQGRTCHRCPSVIPNCHAIIPILPLTGGGLRIADTVQTLPLTGGGLRIADTVPTLPLTGGGLRIADTVPEVACPLLKCRLVFIPEECKELESFEFRGKTCQGCPRHKTGCVPNIARQTEQRVNDAAKNLEQALNNQGTAEPQLPEKACPMFACTLMLIPPECKEDQTFVTSSGRTCKKCPKWREGCVAGGQTPEVSCPLVPCPRILIPAECREEQSYVFRGKTCYRCPKWREGCIPSASKSVPTAGLNAVEPKHTGIGVPEMACPLQACDIAHIPEECRQKKTFQFRGKTCQRCPTWREGCSSVETQNPKDTETSRLPIGSISTATGNEAKISTLPQMFPVDTLRNMIRNAVCPPLPCPNLNIPVQCRETNTYRYRGVTCEGCPRWSTACMSGAFGAFGASNNANVNGLMAFNMFNELLL